MPLIDKMTADCKMGQVYICDGFRDTQGPCVNDQKHLRPEQCIREQVPCRRKATQQVGDKRFCTHHARREVQGAHP